MKKKRQRDWGGGTGNSVNLYDVTSYVKYFNGRITINQSKFESILKVLFKWHYHKIYSNEKP